MKQYSIENITVSMAAVDAVPVLFFAGSAIVVAAIFGSVVFVVGAVLTALGGACKVLWKFLLAWKGKNLFFLNNIFRVCMICGFVLMPASLIVDRKRISGSAVIAGLTGMPQLILFIAGILGMVLMAIFARRLDSTKARSNWIEQITNLIAQGCFFAGLLLIVL